MADSTNKYERGMQERRGRILSSAAALIGRHGVEGMTTRKLAQEAGVTTPTLYNLIGSKDEIVRQMFEANVELVWQKLEFGDDDAPLSMADKIVDSVADFVSQNERVNRELILATDRIAGFYAPKGDLVDAETEASRRSIEMSAEVCRRAAVRGDIECPLSPEVLARQIFISYRGPIRDWAQGLISLDEMMKRQRLGFYLNLAAFAVGEFREELHRRIADVEPRDESIAA